MENENSIISSGRTSDQEVSKKSHIKIAKHGADLIMTSNPQEQERMMAQIGVPDGFQVPTTYEERVKFCAKLISKAMGFTLPEEEVPSTIGFNLTTDSQRKLLFGVLKLMTGTDYRGNVKVSNYQVIPDGSRIIEQGGGKKAEIKVIDIENDGYKVMTGTHIGGAYQNIPMVPVLRITKSDLMRESGFDSDRRNDERDFDKAMSALTLKQNFLMWTRFARDDNGGLKKDKNKRQLFELVSTFSPVLNVRSVLDPQTKNLKYFEVSPAPVFLDEISREYGGINGGYFMLVPEGSYNEVSEAYKRKYPNRKGYIPSSIQALCFWLRLKVQEIQNKDRNPFTKRKGTSKIKIGYFDLCCQLDYGEQTIRKKKTKIQSVLRDGFDIAQELGYIKEWSIDLFTGDYLFDLNLEYYPNEYKKEESTD